eukprot:69622-Rhodomonas_salina.1
MYASSVPRTAVQRGTPYASSYQLLLPGSFAVDALDWYSLRLGAYTTSVLGSGPRGQFSSRLVGRSVAAYARSVPDIAHARSALNIA